MPIYEYSCACGATFEKLTTLAEAHTTQKCPSCGADKAKRILSAASVGVSSSSSGGSDFPCGAGAATCPQAGYGCGGR